MALTLAIDTSWGAGVALVDEDGRALAQRSAADSRRHAEDLVDLVRAVRADAGDPRIGMVAVGKGPAPFTGLRAGLVAARTLGRVWGVPVVGVCALDALARQVLDVVEPAARVVVVTDARRKEVYAGCYTARGAADVACQWGPTVAAPAQVARRLDDRDIVAGPGAARYPQDFPVPAATVAAVDPVTLARLAAHRLARLGAPSPTNGLDTQPLYLRRPDVSVSPQAR